MILGEHRLRQPQASHSHVKYSGGLPRFLSQHANLVWRAVAPLMRAVRNRVHIQLVPAPSTRHVGLAAGAVKGPLLREADDQRQQIRAVVVRTESHQISRAALRTLNAMAHSIGHNATAGDETSRPINLCNTLSAVCHVTEMNNSSEVKVSIPGTLPVR